MAAQMDEHAAAGLEDEEEDGVCLRGSSYQAVGASDLTVHVFFFFLDRTRTV